MQQEALLLCSDAARRERLRAVLSSCELLVRAAPDFADWGGRVVVIVPGSVADATDLRAALSLPFTVVSETPGTHLLDRAGVIIADRFGQIFAVDDAGTEHALPPPREVEEWLKFIGTQCPE